MGEGARSDGDNASLRVSSNATYNDRCLLGVVFVDRRDPSSAWLFVSLGFRCDDAFILGDLGAGWGVVVVLMLFSGEEVDFFASGFAGLVGRGGNEYSRGGCVRTSEIFINLINKQGK